MKKLCSEEDIESCQPIQEALSAEGIEHFLKEPDKDMLFKIQDNALPEIWIVNDSDFERAWLILNSPSQPDDKIEQD